MKLISSTSMHPDVIYRDEIRIELRVATAAELEDLEQTLNQATSSAELYWVEQKKLELFKRIFGF